jgi:hypothetical protein
MNDLNKTTVRHPGRSLLLLGVFLAIVGPVLIILLTFAAKILITPWYAPVLGTLGLALIILALTRWRSIWRWTAVAIVTLFVGFQWYVLFAMRLPVYTGPSEKRRALPGVRHHVGRWVRLHADRLARWPEHRHGLLPRPLVRDLHD